MARPIRRLVAAALLLVGCAPAVPIGTGVSAGSEAAAAAAVAGRFPAAAAGFRRGEARPTADGRGREVGYSAGSGRATAAAVVEVLADATPAGSALDAALADAGRAGPAREMRGVGRFSTAGAGGAPALLCAETAGHFGRERVAGLLCAGRADGGVLLRIKVVMPAREPPPADARAFAEAIAASLSGSVVAATAAPAG
jgi:hypothetical protein